MKIAILLAAAAAVAFADGPGRFISRFARNDFKLTADPEGPHWRGIPGVVAENNATGQPVPGHRTEVRSQWSAKNLYLLYICPYEELYLHPNPSTTTETNKLWEWDVAEAFIGSDFNNVRQYKEFQVSPQSEWVDLDIDRDHPKPEGGWLWNSGFEVMARVDRDKKIWYGEMRIPFEKIDLRQPKRGNELRINLYRIQGPLPNRKGIAWQPTGQRSYHVPEAFGRLVLE